MCHPTELSPFLKKMLHFFFKFRFFSSNVVLHCKNGFETVLSIYSPQVEMVAKMGKRGYLTHREDQLLVVFAL